MKKVKIHPGDIKGFSGKNWSDVCDSPEASHEKTEFLLLGKGRKGSQRPLKVGRPQTFVVAKSVSDSKHFSSQEEQK